MKVVLPSYVAVIGCVPTARFVPVLLVAPVIVNVATPAVDRVAVPFVTVPSLNVTEPAGIAVPDEGRTVAVKTIVRRAASPALLAGLSDDVSPVVVAILTGGATTIRLTGAETLPANVVVPANTATIEWVPGASVLAGTVNAADPVAAMVASPSVLAPSLNVTVPDGIGVVAATTARSVTLSFERIEFADVDTFVIVVIGCGTKVTGSVLEPPPEDVTVIDADGTVMFTARVPVVSSAPRGSVGRLVLAESVGLIEASLDVALILNIPLVSSKRALSTVTSSTSALSLVIVVELGAAAVTRINAGRAVASVGRIVAKNLPEIGSLVRVVGGIPRPVAVRVASPDERANTLIFAVAGAVLE